MSYHIRVRPTALIIKDEKILMVEYKNEDGFHYNLPGGGAEPGETMIEGVLRELWEETMAVAEVGPLAFVYECAPHKQSGDYPNALHSLNLIFECELKEESEPQQPVDLEGDQSAVKWISMDELDSIVLFPNIKPQIKEYIRKRRNIEIIEDYKLESYFKNKRK